MARKTIHESHVKKMSFMQCLLAKDLRGKRERKSEKETPGIRLQWEETSVLMLDLPFDS